MSVELAILDTDFGSSAKCSGEVIEGIKVQIENPLVQLAEVEVYNRFYTATME